MTKKNIGLGLALIVGSGLVGYYLTPTKTVTKIEIKEVIKEVEKKTTESEKKKNNDKIVIIVETILPDGTRRKETKIVDKGTITIDTTTNSDTTKDTDKETKSEKTVERTSPVVIYGIGSVNMTNFAAGPDYGLGVQKQLLGPFWFGGQFQKSGTAGVTFGIGF